MEVRRTALGRAARDRQKILSWLFLHSTATQALTEPGNGSFVFNCLVPFLISFFLVSQLCGKGAALWEGNELNRELVIPAPWPFL